MKNARWIAAAVAAAVAPVSLVSPAHADTDADAVFLSAVDSAGIEYTDPHDAVVVGHQVCDYLYAGHGSDSAARALKISNHSISAKNAARFVAFAETAFCPEKMSG